MTQVEYVSTRGGREAISFKNTILGGLAEDGGLYMPTEYPQFSGEFLHSLRGKSYPRVACEVLRQFAPDIPVPTLFRLCRRAYTAETFRNVPLGHNPKDIVHVGHLWGKTYLCDLNAGPTLAFKDLAMQLIGELFVFTLAGRPMNILGATSGDTGPAAIAAMRGKPGIKTFILSPEKGMSPFQARQMYGVIDDSVFNLVTREGFSEAQAVVKAIMEDVEFKEKYHLGAINSINWGRVAAQVVYYVWSYLKLGLKDGEQFDVAIPAGNFGNSEAARIAKMCGLPIRNIVVASNENDVLFEFFTTGIYRPRKGRVITTSPSMDIDAASNLERFIFDLLGRDGVQVKACYDGLKVTGVIDLSALLPDIARFGFRSARATMPDVEQVIGQMYERTGRIIDPHTAVAFSAATCLQTSDVVMLVLSTAHAAKFGETIEHTLGITPPVPDSMAGWEVSLERAYDIPDLTVNWVKQFIEERVA